MGNFSITWRPMFIMGYLTRVSLTLVRTSSCLINFLLFTNSAVMSSLIIEKSGELFFSSIWRHCLCLWRLAWSSTSAVPSENKHIILSSPKMSFDQYQVSCNLQCGRNQFMCTSINNNHNWCVDISLIFQYELKWYYDENRIFCISAVLTRQQVVYMRRKMLFTIFKYRFLLQRYSSFQNMQISQMMMSYTQPNFDQID